MTETPDAEDGREHPPETEQAPAESGDGQEHMPESGDGKTEYLSELEDGCGCVEVWEHLSERRSDDD